MKGILQFDLDCVNDKLAHTRAVNATSAYLALWDVGQEVFRPARKHGYLDLPELNALLRPNDEDTETSKAVREAISMLEKRFYEILEHRGINLDDLE
jgi:hypothetical protein